MRVATFLLEIGTEELPADFARLALPQLEEQVRHDLAAQRLPHGLVEATGTPRRLVVRVADLPLRQQDLAEERKAPRGTGLHRRATGAGRHRVRQPLWRRSSQP